MTNPYPCRMTRGYGWHVTHLLPANLFCVPLRLDFEAIADVADGLKILRIAGIAFDLRSKRGDAAVDAPRRDNDAVAPDAIQDVVSRQRSAGPLGQECKQGEFLGREFHFQAATAQFICRQIQLKFAERHHPAGWSPMTPQEGV